MARRLRPLPAAAQPDDADFVDEETDGDCVQAKLLAEEIHPVDCHEECNTELFDVRPDDLGTLDVHRNRKNLKIIPAMLFVEFLPTRQVVSASSPTRPAINQHALAPKLIQRHRAAT